ncbi:MAG: hypothetical protein HFH15_15475 [Ruminococcus sp.]|nr:hypothetical protein [Ruminococcus sp.]
MAKKNVCYLCGGKLTDGYCPACGLDNTKIHRKHYHLNESDSVERMNGDDRKAPKKCKEKTEQVYKTADWNTPRPVESPRNTGGQTVQSSQNAGSPPARNSQNNGNQKARPVQPPMQPMMSAAGQPFQPRQTLRNGQRYPALSVPVSGKVTITAAVIVLAVILVGLAAEFVPRNSFDIDNSYRSHPVDIYDFESEDSDPYEYVERELSETGEYYETELEKGEYLIGVHLPEGVYTAKLLEGSGSFSLNDYENGIFLWQAFGTEEEYDEVETMEDIRLYTGARIDVNDGVVLQMVTENGQTGLMENMENPLTETVDLEKDESMKVGEELSAGVYDILDAAGWAVLRCKVPHEGYEEGYYEKSYWLSGDKWDDIYRNIYLTEGMEITAEEGGLLLTPSETVGSGDYEEYYKNYMYY